MLSERVKCILVQEPILEITEKVGQKVTWTDTNEKKKAAKTSKIRV